MNCPSRNDDVLMNPGWNQNPPRFAADLTTCEDLNGIANARELGDADRLCSGSRSLRHCELENQNVKEMEEQPLVVGMGVKGSIKGPCTRTTAHVIDEDRAGLVKGWATWLLSVLATSMLISFVSGNMPSFRFASSHTSALHRLSRRDACASGSAQPNYDLPFHVGGLFIILFVSSTACAFPILVIKFPRLRIPPTFLFGAKHFGTGVLIATAFVHLLPTAFLSLSNPCLSSFWTTDYQAMPGAIMLASIFFVTMIEMVFSPAQHVCGGNEGVAAVSRPAKQQEHKSLTNSDTPQLPTQGIRRTYSEGSMQVREMGPLRGRVTSISRTLSRYREEAQRLDVIESGSSETSETPQIDPKHESEECAVEDDLENNQHNHVLTPEQLHKKAIMQCFLLEMGILFHSIFIGMSLAVAVGNDFIVLLIAIVFHQTFEGLALGVRIADIKWPKRALQPWFMALAYGCTTPLGQAIGIATHTLYSPDSEIGLLVVGIMNAVSAGFLVFASLVELMSEDFLSDESWQILRGKKRVYACLLVFCGAFLMSLVGAWA
ncbi:ZIP zinc transporter-domain-containing protein [Paraphoma chrysanthemicola]|uniref:ZIP zinc transporter-domain-containing protein n=1 Tax=Paraphoma chrysanthemicola TaxID=798071 RepID=A0A8K0VUL1_9PLEO|nr:ZIP zinc transporter-domain-containing protein [Paraphoma chrysanthemicola]